MPRLGRPAGTTAIGVASTLIGIVSFLLTVLGGIVLLAILPGAARPPRPTNPAAGLQPPPTNLQPYSGDSAPPAGLSRAERLAAVQAIDQALPLPAARELMLRRLLAECGRTVFRDVTPPLTTDAARRAFLAAEQLPAGRIGVREHGTLVFRTSAGTLLIDDDMARFVALDGNENLRVEAELVTDSTGKARRSAAAVEIQMARIHAAVGQAATDRQAAVLARHLIDSPDPRPLDARIVGSSTLELGTANSATAWILADGTLILDPGGRDPETGYLIPAARPRYASSSSGPKPPGPRASTAPPRPAREPSPKAIPSSARSRPP